jgi:hypothetical protein
MMEKLSEATIAELMGHSDPQTTRRYTNATDRAKRAAIVVRVGREGRVWPCAGVGASEQDRRLSTDFTDYTD